MYSRPEIFGLIGKPLHIFKSAIQYHSNCVLYVGNNCKPRWRSSLLSRTQIWLQRKLTGCCCWQGQDIESWIYRNIDDREAIISFRGTMTTGHMLTDIDLDLAAFNPGGRRESRSPEEVSDEIPDEEILKGPLEPLMNMCKVVPSPHLAHRWLPWICHCPAARYVVAPR